RAVEPSVAVRDSAGVRIVENRGVDALPALAWRVDEAPAVDIGGEAGPALHQVTDACRLGDGRIVVASSGTQQLHVFGADGRHLLAMGRDGDGPGEFRSIFFVGAMPGDSIATWDPVLSRFSVFSQAGRFVRAVTPGSSSGAPLPRVLGLLPGARFVAAMTTGAAGIPAPGKAARDTLEFQVVDASGALVGSLGRFPGTEQIAFVDGEGMLMRPLPFGQATVAAVHGGMLYVGHGDRYEVSIHRPGAGLRSRIRGDRTRLPVTEGDIQAYRRELVTIGGTQDGRAERQLTQLLDGAPYPEKMPAMMALEVDTDGNVWVQETRRPGDAAAETWTVHSAEGAALGTVSVPRGLRVKQIGRDWILGLALDDAGGEHVRLHRLKRS
ncbi:MAG TPA: hypothetical protein VLK84_05170, partial [Longimicrobium sp.]|nr:hypothetical protein [Longimicrobium sp.]